MVKKNIIHVLIAAMSVGIAAHAFAEEAAPVYDADNYPPAFDEAQGENSAPPAASQQTNYPSQSLSLDQRVARAEQQINNIQNKDYSSKLNSLQTDMQNLRGQIEQLSHQLQLQKRNDKPAVAQSDVQELHAQVEQLSQQLQQLQQQIAVDNKPKAVEAAAPSVPAPTPTPTKSKVKVAAASTPASTKKKIEVTTTTVTKPTNLQPNVEEEQQIYQTAYDLIKVKKYNEAIAALQKMLQKYPTGQFAANAHYWLGELYGLLNNNNQSATEFDTVVKVYPESPKVADAQLKLGLIYAAQFKWSDAKLALKQVINRYPGTASARLASEQLKQIKQAGH